tara:strand:- start:128224 stop:128880 length:657 start_codon:yes stop_codon:yes gene_type:complete
MNKVKTIIVSAMAIPFFSCFLLWSSIALATQDETKSEVEYFYFNKAQSDFIVEQPHYGAFYSFLHRERITDVEKIQRRIGISKKSIEKYISQLVRLKLISQDEHHNVHVLARKGSVLSYSEGSDLSLALNRNALNSLVDAAMKSEDSFSPLYGLLLSKKEYSSLKQELKAVFERYLVLAINNRKHRGLYDVVEIGVVSNIVGKEEIGLLPFGAIIEIE